jgi:opacity protein-like surface antigen
LKTITKSVFACLAVLAVGTSTQAIAQAVHVPVSGGIAVDGTGWYLSVFGGGAWPGFAEFNYTGSTEIYAVDTEPGWLAGVAAGARVMQMLRAEVELSHSAQTFSGVNGNTYSGRLGVTHLLGNLWFDFPVGSMLAPYVGGGVGVGVVAFDDASGWFDSISVFKGFGLAYQVGGGIVVNAADNISIDIGYRYRGVSGAEIENERPIEGILNLGNHIVQIGVRAGL